MPGPAGARVLVTGATGLVGSECVRRLASHPAFGAVIAIVRRELPPALRLPGVEQRIADFEALGALDDIGPATHALCALGTTIRQAGSRERFRRVDHDYVVATAELGLRCGARHFLLVSALGADPNSRVFYNRVKGETEMAVRTLGYRALTIVRPSLLLGERGERRFGEELAKRFAFLMPGRMRPVQAGDVAAALVACAAEDRPGPRVIESDEIRRMASR